MYDYIFNTIAAFDVYYFFNQLYLLLKNAKIDAELYNFAKTISDKAKTFIDTRLASLDIKNLDKFKNNEDNIAKTLILEMFEDCRDENVSKEKIEAPTELYGFKNTDEVIIEPTQPGFHYRNVMKGNYNFKIVQEYSDDNMYERRDIGENPENVKRFVALKKTDLETDDEFDIDIDLSNLLTK